MSSNNGLSYLRVCKEDVENSNVEFEYYNSQHSMPVEINNLKFNSSELVINLKESDYYGYETVRMDLTPDMIVGRGLFSSFAGGKHFTDKECKLEESKKDEWKINCQIND